MKYLLLSLICIIAALGCSTTLKNKYSSRVIDYRVESEFLDFNGVLQSLSMNLRVAYVQDLTLYRTLAISLRPKPGTPEVIADTTFQYFVIKSGDKSGLKYDSSLVAAPTQLELKTFLEERGLDSNNLYELLSPKANQVEVIKNSRTGDVEIEKFAFPVSTGGVDSTYHFFDKSLKSIPFSISGQIDSASNSKLVRYVTVTAPRPKSDKKKAFPRTVFERRIWEPVNVDWETLNKMLGRYRKESTNFKLR